MGQAESLDIKRAIVGGLFYNFAHLGRRRLFVQSPIHPKDQKNLPCHTNGLYCFNLNGNLKISHFMTPPLHTNYQQETFVFHSAHKRVEFKAIQRQYNYWSTNL